jgi:hypothetical protein
LNKIKKYINEEIETLENEFDNRTYFPILDSMVKISPQSNKDDFLVFCYSVFNSYMRKISFRLYGYSKNLYYNWVKPEYRSCRLRLCSQIIIKPFYLVEDTEQIFLFKNLVLKQLEKTPEFLALFKSKPDSDTMELNDEGVNSIAYIDQFYNQYIQLLEGGLISQRKSGEYWIHGDVMNAGFKGIVFRNHFGDSITVYYNYSGNAIEIRTKDNDNKHKLNIVKHIINLFTSKISVGGYVFTGVILNELQLYKNDFSDNLYYDPKTNTFTRTSDRLGEKYPANLNTKESVYISDMFFVSDGDLVFKENYNDVFLPQYIHEVEKRERKNHNFISPNIFGWPQLCRMITDPKLKMSGTTISSGKGRILFFETLKVLKNCGYTWIVLQPACQVSSGDELLKLYSSWGVKYIISTPYKTIDPKSMYDKIDDILTYENK